MESLLGRQKHTEKQEHLAQNQDPQNHAKVRAGGSLGSLAWTWNDEVVSMVDTNITRMVRLMCPGLKKAMRKTGGNGTTEHGDMPGIKLLKPLGAN